jgi:hypothetical protein
LANVRASSITGSGNSSGNQPFTPLALTSFRPCLLDCANSGYSIYSNEPSAFPELDERDTVTIRQDAQRSFTRFPGTARPSFRLTKDLDDAKRAELQEKLEITLKRVLRIHPRLHYVQVSLGDDEANEGIS